MKVEHVRPFAEALVEVCTSLLGESAKRGTLAIRGSVKTSQQINIVCAISGGVQGHVVLGMSTRTASRVAARMIGQPVVTFNSLAASAIAEFANMIGGRSLTLFEAQGFSCSLTPPIVIREANARVSGAIGPAIAIPIELAEFGEIELQVSLGVNAQAA